MRKLLTLALLLIAVGASAGVEMGGRVGLSLKGGPVSSGALAPGIEDSLTQAQQVPMFAVRFDDFGLGDRTDQPDMWEYYLSRGLKISIAVSYFAISPAESVILNNAITAYPGLIEIWNHTNGNLDATRYGGASATDYEDMSPADWDTELRPDYIKGMCGLSPVGVIWPGDDSGARRTAARRRGNIIEPLFHKYGYLAGIDYVGFSSTTADSFTYISMVPSTTSDGNRTARDWVGPGVFSRQIWDFWMLPDDQTFDLTDPIFMERPAAADPNAPSWVPPGTTRFVAAEEFSNADATHNAPCVAYASFRERVSRGLESRGGMTFVCHSDSATNTLAASWANDGQGAIIVAGRMDSQYAAATFKALLDEGIIQWGSLGDRLRWMATPPKSGTKIAGFESAVMPFVDIADTVGVYPLMPVGIGAYNWDGGAINNSSIDNSVTRWSRDTRFQDDDHDGVPNGGDGTEWQYVIGGGEGGVGNCLEFVDASGTAGYMRMTWPDLRPGDYTIRFVVQGQSSIRTTAACDVTARGINLDSTGNMTTITNVLGVYNAEMASFATLNSDTSAREVYDPTGTWITHEETFTIPKVPTAYTSYAPRQFWSYAFAMQFQGVCSSNPTTKKVRYAEVSLIWEAP